MRNRRYKGMLAGGVLAALILGSAVGTAAAAKPTVSATVNGKHVKWRGRLVLFNYGPSGLIIVATKVRATKTIGLGCPILLEVQTFPVTMTVCSASYQQGIGVHGKAYLAPTGVQVTFTSFDGTIVQGTFTGTLVPLPGRGEGTIAVQGAFRGPIRR